MPYGLPTEAALKVLVEKVGRYDAEFLKKNPKLKTVNY